MKIFILSAGKCSVVMLSAGALQRINPGMKRQQHPLNRQGICGDAGPHSTIHSHLQGHPPAPRRDTAQGTDLSPQGEQLCVQLSKQTPSHTFTQTHTQVRCTHIHTYLQHTQRHNTDIITYTLRHTEENIITNRDTLRHTHT